MKIGRDTAHTFGLFPAIVAMVAALDARKIARLDRMNARLATANAGLAAPMLGFRLSKPDSPRCATAWPASRQGAGGAAE